MNRFKCLQLATMKKQMNNQTTNLEKILSHDQIEALRHPSFKAASWSDKTIEKCLQIRAATGHKGFGVNLTTLQNMISIKIIRSQGAYLT